MANSDMDTVIRTLDAMWNLRGNDGDPHLDDAFKLLKESVIMSIKHADDDWMIRFLWRLRGKEGGMSDRFDKCMH